MHADPLLFVYMHTCHPYTVGIVHRECVCLCAPVLMVIYVPAVLFMYASRVKLDERSLLCNSGLSYASLPS